MILQDRSEGLQLTTEDKVGYDRLGWVRLG